jgi:outer membrane immunogenic protein
MKKAPLAAMGLVVMGTPVFAADLPARTYAPPPMVAAVYDWSGFYVGLNGGGGWNRSCWTNTGLFGVATVPSAPEGCLTGSGGTAGGQIGYRWQSANWVFGVEAQGNWADFSGTAASLAFPLITNRTKVDAFGLFTGQIGYAWSNALLYVKGGAAVTDNKYAGIITATGVQRGGASDTRWGGAVGVGIEYVFAPNWSAGIEYDHLFMGTRNVGFTGVPPFNPNVDTRLDSISKNIDMVTARINYRFGGPVVARY